MIYQIVCPEQQPDQFDIEACFNCRYFDMHLGKHTSVKCRKNRSPQHKRDFEGAVLSAWLGIPDEVFVEGHEESISGPGNRPTT